MRPYLSFFKLRFAMGLQYRFSAFAGLLTQFFWGIFMLLLYEAFYNNGVSTPMPWKELVSYVWMGQALYTIVYFRVMDTDVMNSIQNGQVAYEFVRPLNIYWMWFVKTCAIRTSACLLRIAPIILVASLLPQQYSLTGPESIAVFFLFLATLILGLFISTAIAMLIYIFMFYTTSCRGVFFIFSCFADFFSGMSIPIVFMPQIMQTICFILPFRLCMDLPIRLYAGNITVSEGIESFLAQIAWVLVLTFSGNFLMKKVAKRLIVQGG